MEERQTRKSLRVEYRRHSAKGSLANKEYGNITLEMDAGIRRIIVVLQVTLLIEMDSVENCLETRVIVLYGDVR